MVRPLIRLAVRDAGARLGFATGAAPLPFGVDSGAPGSGSTVGSVLGCGARSRTPLR